MSAPAFDLRATAWLESLNDQVPVDGLVRVNGYDPVGRPATEVAVIEKAAAYGAHAVFFEAGRNGREGQAQAFVFVSDGPANDPSFALLHQRLWSWGGVPLVYRRTPSLVQLFRCAHRPDFIGSGGELKCNPFETLRIGAEISALEAWWDAERLRNGTIWDDAETARKLLSADQSAHRKLVTAVRNLDGKLKASAVLSAGLRRRLLILSLLVAYLDQRGALPERFFSRFRPEADRFPQVLADGSALLDMLEELEGLFNGDVFALDNAEKDEIRQSAELVEFSRMIEAREEKSGQRTLWALYSFRDLPVEVISHIYELFVTDPSTSVYTPPAMVRLILDEVLDEPRIDRLIDRREVLLDPACGSGVFLVEAFKRLVLHWRSKNGWARPSVNVLRDLLGLIHGVDLEDGAIELATFSICLAMCDALTPEQILATPKLFPKLRDAQLQNGCFFERRRAKSLPKKVGVVVGNPPFESKLKTEGANKACADYEAAEGQLADRQVAYLFLHEAVQLLQPGGALGMLQQYNLLYNSNSAQVRIALLRRWDVREVLDFVSVRGMFRADTKVLAVIVHATEPPEDRAILHAVFRRTSRAEAEQRFDIDYYDLHWLPRHAVLSDRSPDMWRANLLGGARTYSLVRRLRSLPTLEAFAESRGWDFGEGFSVGSRPTSRSAEHLYDQLLLPSDALSLEGVDESRMEVVDRHPIEWPRTAARFTPPMLLVREQENLPHVLWDRHFLTYKNKIVGFAGRDVQELAMVDRWLARNAVPLRAYAAAISLRMFTQKATTLSSKDIFALPFDPVNADVGMSDNEMLVATDIVEHYRDFVRLGSSSALAKTEGADAADEFARIFCRQINALYRDVPLRSLGHRSWPGILCLAFAFGDGEVDWGGTDELRGRLDALLREQRGAALSMTRIARIYDGNFVFLLKPDRLRYWLPSSALRDSDDTLADLRAQGF